MVVTVFGLGFVGLTTAVGFSQKGVKVYGYDVDQPRMETIEAGKLPFFEPGLDEALAYNLNRTFFPTRDMEAAVRESDCVYYCVGTPYGEEGQADLTYLYGAIESTLKCIDDDKFRVLVTKSTIPPSTTQEKIIPFVEKLGVGVGKQISNLYIARMASPCELETVQVLLTTPDYDWERVGFWVNEGPAVIKREGKIFMTYSASETGVAYCMGMLTADEDADLLDPLSWRKERYPVLGSDETAGIYGPGHNCFTVDEEGHDIMVYHARTETKIEGNPLYNPNRHAMLMQLEWKDGRPVFRF